MKPERSVNPDVDLDWLFGGAVEIIGREVLEQKIRSGKRLIVKHGVDPTARDLHLGYAVNYQVMRRFQDAGHTVVLLIGDFTCRIGDPTGRDKTRPRLTEDQIQANTRCMLEQIDRVLDVEHLVVRRNSEWLSQMDLAAFLDLGTRLSAARMWEREMFRRRLEKGLPVHLHEFLYPVLQGYDSYALEADLTVNGSDQKFNELMGREIQGLFGQSPQALVIMPILPGTDGTEKMSQSLGNYVGLAEAPEQQFGKVMSIPDALMPEWFTLATRLSPEQVQAVQAEQGPMEAKMRLAREIVGQYHDTPAAAQAQAHFLRVHRDRAVPEDVPRLQVPAADAPIWICEALKRAGLTRSTSEALRALKGGGLRVGGQIVCDRSLTLAPGKHLVQKGKRHFLEVEVLQVEVLQVEVPQDEESTP